MLPAPVTAPRLTFGPFTFDRGSRLLRRGDELVALPPRVVAVLEILLERPGDLVSRQELIDTAWKDAFVTDTSLAEAVSFLRQALGDDPQAPGYIQTVHRRGYRFIAPVAPQLPAAPEPLIPEEAPRPAAVSPSIARQLVPWSVAALSLATAIAAVWQLVTREGAALPIVRFEVTAAPAARFDVRAPALAIAPGGSHLAWSGCDDRACRLYVRALDRTDATALAGTEGASAPFFSPDGRWVGFFSGGKLRKVSVTGGAPVAIADSADALGGTWTPGGSIVFAGARLGLSLVHETGGEVREVTRPQPRDGEVRHAWPSLAADGKTLFFTIVTSSSGDSGGRIAVMRVPDRGEQGSWKTVLEGGTRAVPIGTDGFVFSRGLELAGIGFDAVRLGVFGTAQALVSGLSDPHGARQFAASTSGSLAHIAAEHGGAIDDQWFAASAVSPDGGRVAAAIPDGARTDIWVASLESGAATRLTHDGVNGSPVWSPDGRAVHFAKRLTGAYEVWTRDAEAASPAVRVLAAAGHAIPLSSSAVANALLILQTSEESGLDVWLMPTIGGTPRPLVRTPFDETAATLSPDGRFVAYQSNESGRWDVHALRLEDGRRTVVSADGGVAPSWEADGLRIRYQAGTRTMIASLLPSADLRVLPATEASDGARPAPVAIEAGGRVRFETAPRSHHRAILALSFDRELRQRLGPPPGAMPR